MQIQVICTCRSITRQQWGRRHTSPAMWLREIRTPPRLERQACLPPADTGRAAAPGDRGRSRICRCSLRTGREAERCLSNTGSTPACRTPGAQGGKPHMFPDELQQSLPWRSLDAHDQHKAFVRQSNQMDARQLHGTGCTRAIALPHLHPSCQVGVLATPVPHQKPLP